MDTSMVLIYNVFLYQSISPSAVKKIPRITHAKEIKHDVKITN